MLVKLAYGMVLITVQYTSVHLDISFCVLSDCVALSLISKLTASFCGFYSVPLNEFKDLVLCSCSGGHELSKSTGNAGGRVACGAFTGSPAPLLPKASCRLSQQIANASFYTPWISHCIIASWFPGIIGLQG